MRKNDMGRRWEWVLSRQWFLMGKGRREGRMGSNGGQGGEKEGWEEEKPGERGMRETDELIRDGDMRDKGENISEG